MSAIAALLDTRAGLVALRRTLPTGTRVVACRSAAALARAYRRHLLDSVVLGIKAQRQIDLPAIRQRYPGIPLVVYGGFRPADGELARGMFRAGVAALLVEGVDDAVAGSIIRRHGLGAARNRALADAPRVLRLREPIQRDTWHYLVGRAGEAVATSEVADWLDVSREHLSRQFGAGGAPNLKRVIDLLRIVAAGQLLANPGYTMAGAVAILGFSSTSHLHATSRRVTGRLAGDIAGLGPKGILAAFLKVGTRSRG